MARTSIYLIRHGSNPRVGKGLTGWLPGVSLDELGQRQAECLAGELCGISLSAIYSSPLERALETAAPLASVKNLTVVSDPAFGEVRFGAWEGLDYSDIESDPLWERFNGHRSGTRAPGGELMLETQARVVGGLLKLADRHPEQEIAVFSHADAIKSALCWILGIPLDFHERLEIAPASVSGITVSVPGVPQVRWINRCYCHNR